MLTRAKSYLLGRTMKRQKFHLATSPWCRSAILAGNFTTYLGRIAGAWVVYPGYVRPVWRLPNVFKVRRKALLYLTPLQDGRWVDWMCFQNTIPPCNFGWPLHSWPRTWNPPSPYLPGSSSLQKLYCIPEERCYLQMIGIIELLCLTRRLLRCFIHALCALLKYKDLSCSCMYIA